MKKLNSNRKEIAYTALMGIAGIAFIIFVWDFAVSYTDLGIMIPRPWEVFRNLARTTVEPIGMLTIWQHTLVSLRRVMIGFILASSLGTIMGLAMGFFPKVDAIIKPIFGTIRQIPAVAWIPLAILWFGIGESSKLFIIFIAAFCGLVVNIYSGTKRIDYELQGVAKVLGASQKQVYYSVILPSTIPYIFAGLQYALSISWMAVLAAEMISSTEGLGWMIVAGMQSANMVQVLTAMICIGVIGLLLAQIMRLGEKIVCRWRIRGN